MEPYTFWQLSDEMLLSLKFILISFPEHLTFIKCWKLLQIARGKDCSFIPPCQNLLKKKKHICNIYNFRSWIYTNRKFPVVATQNNAGKHKKFPLQAKTINCLNTTGSTYLPVTSMQPQNKKENNKIATILYSQLLFWSSTWFVILIWH